MCKTLEYLACVLHAFGALDGDDQHLIECQLKALIADDNTVVYNLPIPSPDEVTKAMWLTIFSMTASCNYETITENAFTLYNEWLLITQKIKVSSMKQRSTHMHRLQVDLLNGTVKLVSRL